MMKPRFFGVSVWACLHAIFWVLVSSVAAAHAEKAGPAPVSSLPGKLALRVSEKPQAGDFQLVVDRRAADVYVDAGDFKVAQIAAACFSEDVERVTGVKPRIIGEARGLSTQAVLVGTLGKSALIDELVRAGKLDAHAIAGKWESFVVATVEKPLPGVERALVIAGSDRRGTAFGVFTLSEAIGVSPWVWWADVPAVKRAGLVIGAGAIVSGPPSVTYRGIFINDEDWGLQPWAAKTFEPETRDIGPKTYAKVFELLLRLKANYLWPAMHPSTKAFNHYPKNKSVADDYAIVMGSSHAEPMLRNNVDEWDVKARGAWDYTKNSEQVLKYWEERVAENARFENIYTLGMRGIHDSGMEGQGTTAEKVARIEEIFARQRAMLAKYVNPRAEQVPQIFVPYKEVLGLYRNGLKVPADVTLVWVDDNHGYIRQLSTPAEQKRSGGAGVYYHISYWGAPEDYLWLESISPALMWEEMHKAYENGADRVWVVNVGDIKPAEIGMEFFLRMAWDISPWDEKSQAVYLADWSARTFGGAHASDVAAVLDEYYRLNFAAKPEHMHLARFTQAYDETGERLRRFNALVTRANAISDKLAPEFKDAFYELVLFPVRGAALLNRVHLSPTFEEARHAYDQIQMEVTHFNERVAGGKWKYILSANPRNRPALREPTRESKTAPAGVEGSEAGDERGRADDGGYFSFEAERPTRAVTGDAEIAWKTIVGLGRSGDSIALLPTTRAVPEGAALEYDFTVQKTGEAKVVVYCLPTQALNADLKARCAVSVDGGGEQIFEIGTAEYGKDWRENVIRAAAIHTSAAISLAPGKHTLRVRPLDPGLVFDKVVIDLGGLKATHLGPPATARGSVSE